MVFVDRVDAGRRLAAELGDLRGADVVVLGLPRGGVPVAFEVACALGAPLDVIVVRKLGVPYQPEVAMGAVGEDGVRVLDLDLLRSSQVTPDELAGMEAAARTEIARRAERFRIGRPRIALRGRTALIVDDGVATGSTARAACQVARAEGAERVVLAVPVGAPSAIAALRQVADAVVCLETPRWFHAVGQWYDYFGQSSDDEVVELLHRAAGRTGQRVPVGLDALDPPVRDEEVGVTAGAVELAGRLTVPETCSGIVIFAHGSGSSRHSPRNRFVAKVLFEAGIGTLLFDLLTEGEERDRRSVFDIDLLAGRLLDVTGWLRDQAEADRGPVGYFGASTGAGAALWAAADPGADVAAIVSRGGRPDLAMGRLHLVRCPTLFVVGGRDEIVLDLNRRAQRELRCPKDLALVPGATHLFEEPGTLEQAAGLARDWFLTHFAVPAQRGADPVTTTGTEMTTRGST